MDLCTQSGCALRESVGIPSGAISLQPGIPPNSEHCPYLGMAKPGLPFTAGQVHVCHACRDDRAWTGAPDPLAVVGSRFHHHRLLQRDDLFALHVPGGDRGHAVPCARVECSVSLSSESRQTNRERRSTVVFGGSFNRDLPYPRTTG